MPRATSGIFFNEAKLSNKVKITGNHTIGLMASIKRMIKKPSLTPRHKGLCIGWSRKCMAVVMMTVLFTDGIIHEDDHVRR